MDALGPLDAIDMMIAQKRRMLEEVQRELSALEKDLAALEHTRSLFGAAGANSARSSARGDNALAAALLRDPTSNSGGLRAVLDTGIVVSPTPGGSDGEELPRAWHPDALRLFEDGKVHSTAEVNELVQRVTGGKVGYSAVASWLNRMADDAKGVLAKVDGERGKFYNPRFATTSAEVKPSSSSVTDAAPTPTGPVAATQSVDVHKA